MTQKIFKLNKKKKVKVEEFVQSFKLHFFLNNSLKGNENIVDFSEKKLINIITQQTDERRTAAIEAILSKYKEGEVAVGWIAGALNFIRFENYNELNGLTNKNEKEGKQDDK